MVDFEPRVGDFTIVFAFLKLALVLGGQRTLDFWKAKYAPGRHLPGCGGKLHGVTSYHRVAAVDAMWNRIRLRHLHASL